MILLFAVVLACLATKSPAQQPVAGLQYDGSTAIDPHVRSGGAVPVPCAGQTGRTNLQDLRRTRPVYVELSAFLANFDADADPDGWRARIVLRDRNDQPTVMRSQATFRLMPRVSTIAADRYLDALQRPIRWSMPLHFDQDGVAQVKLPLRQSLRPMLGWPDAVYPQSGLRSHNAGLDRSQLYRNRRTRSFVTTDLRTVGTPSVGQLSVRVSVPTQGVFDSVVPVQIRPSVLVDTQWPYR